MNFQEKKILYKVRTHTLEMLEARKMVVPEELRTVTFEQFAVQFEERNIDIFIHDETTGNKIYLFFQIDDSFGKNDMKTLVERTFRNYADDGIHMILMLKEEENTTLGKEKSKILYRNVEIFHQKMFTINITRHSFVPKHIILSPEEEEQVLEKYQTPKSKFPIIPASDAQARYYGMKPDQMCKILRIDPEVGYSISYRVVR